jgi:hypothetical protein
MVVVAVALLGGGCRKKPGLVRTPVTQLDPLGGSTPAPLPVAEDVDDAGQPAPSRAADAPDAGLAAKKAVAPAKASGPSVASPYLPGGGSEHLPMWRQRAKFF